ncbi:condensation domain-containing protein [Actinomadura sp. LOL_016]|uniref:condensation domain-containing protein n=1 Tax=unclassified Actinomadura TaxID=2626254 RepID=UPI003A812C12
MTPTRAHAVAFSGGGAGEHPCTWGQLDMWREMEWARDPAHGNVVGGGFLPPGHTVDRVVRVLGDMVGRYEALRTGFVPAADGRPVQRILDAGVLEVEVRELDGDPLRTTMRWVAESEAEPHDLAGGVPLRPRIGTVDGEPRLIIMGMPHVTADYLGSRVLFDEIGRALDGRAPAAPRGLQPAEKAAAERADGGRAVLRRSLEHWRRSIDAAPAVCFADERRPAESPRYWTGVLTSPSAPGALRVLADRHRVGTTHVLLAALGTLIGRYTGRRSCLARMVVANRARPELRNAVGTFSQEAAAVVDLAAGTFAAMVRGARVSALHAMRHGQYDPDAKAEIVAAAGAEPDVYFNDMWTATRDGRGVPVAADAVESGRSTRTRFAWGTRLDRAGVRFFFEATEVVADPGAIDLTLLADTAHVPPADLRTFLFGLEELLTVLAADDGGRLDEVKLVNDPGA